MKRTWIIAAALVLSGCASHRSVARQELRTDTFRAGIAEQMSVCLDDIIILPRDTIHPVVIAHRAEVKRNSVAKVVNIADERVNEKPVQEIKASPVWPLLAMFALAVIIIWLKK